MHQYLLSPHTRHVYKLSILFVADCLHRSEHSLPITSIHCGLGEANAIIATASLDRTCKIWSLASGALLRSVTLPAGVTAVTLDAGEHAMYTGTNDGTIFEVALVGGDDASSDSDRQQAAAAAGPGPSSVAQQQLLQAQRLQRQQDAAQGRVRMEGHGAAVSSLGASLDGERLISGGMEGPYMAVGHATCLQLAVLAEAPRWPPAGYTQSRAAAFVALIFTSRACFLQRPWSMAPHPHTTRHPTAQMHNCSTADVLSFSILSFV